jgi:hypothetical protein
MHPSEMKNSFLAAAAKAKQDGFAGTAAALLLLAEACSSEARDLSDLTGEEDPYDLRNSPLSGKLISLVSH